MSIGDVYNILETGANYVWTEYGWDKLSETIDLTPYLTKEEAKNTYETIINVDNKIFNANNITYTTLNNKIDEDFNELNNIKQNILTAGDGISIENGLISGTKVIIKFWN